MYNELMIAKRVASKARSLAEDLGTWLEERAYELREAADTMLAAVPDPDEVGGLWSLEFKDFQGDREFFRMVLEEVLDIGEVEEPRDIDGYLSERERGEMYRLVGKINELVSRQMEAVEAMLSELPDEDEEEDEDE